MVIILLWHVHGFLTEGQGVVDYLPAVLLWSLKDSSCLLFITPLLSCCKHPVKIFIEACCDYSGTFLCCAHGFLTV